MYNNHVYHFGRNVGIFGGLITVTPFPSNHVLRSPANQVSCTVLLTNIGLDPPS